ncbi:MAG: putative hemolysin [Planctomycetota bacterium]|jgi:putative hemolysin
MDLAHVPLWTWIVLTVLLLISASFSATETALFGLSGQDRQKAGGAALELLDRPRDMLVTVLLGNLLANLLFFGFSMRLEPPSSDPENSTSVLIGVIALLLVILFGEILPKTIGLRGGVFVARVFSPLLLLGVRFLGPVANILSSCLDFVLRLLGERFQEGGGLTPEGLAEVLERSGERGVLLETEADFLSEIVELDSIRVREIMTPRVDVLFLDIERPMERDEAVRQALKNRLSWLPVVRGAKDEVIGRVHVRDLVNYPERPVGELVMPVEFVPEVASALDLLHSLREVGIAEAVVVDEWGGTAGVVTLEDIFEEIVGDLREEEELQENPVISLGNGRYRVNGSLSIRDWNDEFGTRVVPTEFETVGGFVTALLGRIAKPGDVVRHRRLVMKVQEVRGLRVLTVDMHLASAAQVQS